MYFQIKEIILWPRYTIFKPRRLPFELGKVNVITGYSRTGKSAIIPIIDYCLGSERCTIPVNTIRDTCSWFGVLADTVQGEKLFVRREPGEQRSTNEMFILEGKTVDIPDVIPEKNATTDVAKRILDELAGLTELDFNYEGVRSGFQSRPSFRDLSAFTFQPQNIVANPNVLFYKADTQEHRERLRIIFPYILDAMNAEILAKHHELQSLKRIWKRKDLELSNIKQASDRWLAEIQSTVSRARELGLIDMTPTENSTQEELIKILRRVAERTENTSNISDSSISESIKELESLNEEQREMSLRLNVLKQRQNEMAALRSSASAYRRTLQVRRDRLNISEWIAQHQGEEHDCPVCGNNLEDPLLINASLQSSLRNIERQASQLETVPVSFDRESERVRIEIDRLSESMKAIDIRITKLQESSAEASKKQYDNLSISRFIGNIEQAIQTYSQINLDTELRDELEELKNRIEAIEALLSEHSVEGKKNRALQAVNLNAGRFLPNLDVEKPNDPIVLSITDLTIRVNGVARSSYLWEIGSGSNWLSYHIAITLGLHQFFLDLLSSPVPGFIVYDQPSQVYFPKKLREESENLENNLNLNDEDAKALNKVFRVFSEMVSRNQGAFQIIVLDHAPDLLWKDVNNIHLAGEWRGEKLIPEEWIEAL